MRYVTILVISLAWVLALPPPAGAAGKGKKAADPGAPPAGVRWAVDTPPPWILIGGDGKAASMHVYPYEAQGREDAAQAIAAALGATGK